MADEQLDRRLPTGIDVGGILAIIYTAGYIGMVGGLFFVVIPLPNKEPLLQLFGLMSAIQMALISFFFGSSKTAEVSHRSSELRQGRTDAIVQDIAKSVPIAAALAAATVPTNGHGPVVTPAPETADGIIPAAAVATAPSPAFKPIEKGLIP